MSEKRRDSGQGFIVGAFIVLTILTVGQFIDSRLEDQRQRDHLERVQEDLKTSLSASTAQTRALIDQIETDGQTPVVDPSEVPDVDDVESGEPVIIPGPPGQPGPPPSNAQVRAALVRYCQTANCKPAPTAAQVADALTSYCSSTGRCRGPRGEVGASGADGLDGATGATGATGEKGEKGDPGERGPGPTPEQLLAAVTEYCGTGACAGTTTISLANCAPEPGLVVTGIQSSGSAREGYTLTCSKALDITGPGNGGGNVQ